MTTETKTFPATMTTKIAVGDAVLFRGRFAHDFTIRGTIEEIDDYCVGVRLENGNFHRCGHSQIKVSQ